MIKHISFGKIGQFRNVVKDVIHSAQYQGLDEGGEPIMDWNATPPTVVFTGTVKLHGTNAAFCCNAVSGHWFQSRSRILSIGSDNAECALYNEKKVDTYMHLASKVADRERISVEENTVSIYFEWCGGNIQKGTALTGLDKMAVIIAVKISPFDEEKPAYYVDPTDLSSPSDKIYNIHDFPTYSLAIDFSNPGLAQSVMANRVDQVEEECPVGKAFGRELGKDNTVGEGLVWVGYHEGCRYVFKTKGQKHSVSNVKTVASYDPELQESVDSFVKYAVSENRLRQGIEEVFASKGVSPAVEGTGDFLRWVVNDITTEEEDVIVESSLPPKMVNKAVGHKARQWFFTFLEGQI